MGFSTDRVGVPGVPHPLRLPARAAVLTVAAAPSDEVIQEMTPLSRHTLLTALVGALLPPDVPESDMLRGWLDSWSGVGHVLDAMTAAGHHVELRQSVFGWRAEFY